MSDPVRVLVVDDSALMRKLIPQILATDSSIEVVGTAMDGRFALKKIEELKPQVITLDLEMPSLNGIDTIKEIMRRWKLPVIVVSSHSTAGASITLKALGLGAFDFVAKPQDVSARMPEIAAELINKIKAAAQSKGVRLKPVPEGMARKPRSTVPAAPTRIVAIGVSTGGPNALQYLFSQLPAEFPGSVLVVQHMPLNEQEHREYARLIDQIKSATDRKDRAAMRDTHIEIHRELCSLARAAFNQYNLQFPPRVEDEMIAFYNREWPI